MKITTRPVALVGIVLLCGCSSRGAREPAPTAPIPETPHTSWISTSDGLAAGSITFLSPRLREPYTTLLTRSGAFRVAMEAFLGSGGTLVLGYEADFPGDTPWTPLTDSPASVHTFLNTQGSVVEVVRFTTSALEIRAMRAGISREQVTLELAAVLGHEVFGHIVPRAVGDSLGISTLCPDIDIGPNLERTPGCAIHRENIIRRDLGLPERLSYEVHDLQFICIAVGEGCSLATREPPRSR